MIGCGDCAVMDGTRFTASLGNSRVVKHSVLWQNG